MTRFRLSSPLLLALGCLPACYCSHQVIGDEAPDLGTVIELSDAGPDLADSARPDDATVPTDSSVDATVESDASIDVDGGPVTDMGVPGECNPEATDPDRICVPAAQGGVLAVERSSMLGVELPNPGPLCATVGSAKCEVRIDWDSGVLDLCVFRVLTPSPPECPLKLEAQCHFPRMELERTWRVRINGEESFRIDSREGAVPETMDRCTELGPEEDLRVQAQ